MIKKEWIWQMDGVKECPIQLDESPEFCSAGTCDYCREQQKKFQGEDWIDRIAKFGKNIQWMMVLILLLTFGCTPANGQVLIETEIFTVEYSEEFEQPLKIDYIVQCPFGDVSRSGMDFEVWPEVKTSDDDDYYKNVWDKGHLAPANSFNCDKETLEKTFVYINSALQHQSLNRGVWSQLESFEKSLAMFYEVSVTIEVLFDGSPQVLPTGATVPTGFIKILRWDDRTAVFYFPNENTSGTDWEDYLKR